MDFENEFNRVPEINEKDFQWLIDRTTKYYVEKMINPASRDQEPHTLSHKEKRAARPAFFLPLHVLQCKHGEVIALLHSGGGDPLVDAGDDAEEGNACGTDAEGDLRTFVALEGGQRLVGLRDVHSLHDEQVLVE